MKFWKLSILALLSGASLGLGAQEPAGSPTLSRIAGQHTLYLGYRENAEPFTYADGKGGVQGYQWELCQQVVQAIKARVPGQEIRVVPVLGSANTRALMLANGMMDLDCGPVANTLIAQKQLAFSVTTYVSSMQVLVRRDAQVAQLGDLNGKTVVSLAGSAGERYLKTANGLKGASLQHLGARSPQEGFALLQAGKAQALVVSDVTAALLLAQAQDRENYRVLGEALAFEPLAMAMRKDDPELKRLVDETLAGLMRSGEAGRIYERWFQSPMPPAGLNLQLPMGDLLRGLLQNPNDQGV